MPKAKGPFTVEKWKGRDNHVCTECPRSDLDKENLQRFQAMNCSLARCPGKPRLESETIVIPKPRRTRAPRTQEITATTNGTEPTNQEEKIDG